MRTAVAALCLTACAHAADFQTKPARDAHAAYYRDVQAAQEAYDTALSAAREQYFKALDDAAKSAASSQP